MGVCMLTWARSPGRILPGLPTPGPPDRPRLLVWLSRLWYSMGDCNAGQGKEQRCITGETS